MTPIPDAMISKMPNCSGSTPTRIAAGRKIGAAIRIAGNPSSRNPMTINAAILRNRNSTRSCAAVSAPPTATPNPSTTTACASTFAHATISSTIPAVSGRVPNGDVNPPRARRP